jgi:hypothetical protein
MKDTRYWIAVVSKEHAMRAVKGGFIQVCHGKEAPLKRIASGDWVAIYSPKLAMDQEEKCQAFTAIGQASDGDVYPFRMTDSFVPFRRNISFYECHETSILPLIDQLSFIRNKKSWGFPFRFGFFEIDKDDFELIRSNMMEYEISR